MPERSGTMADPWQASLCFVLLGHIPIIITKKKNALFKQLRREEREKREKLTVLAREKRERLT
jgi:hypothetical protein